jgi:hypothetical protein
MRICESVRLRRKAWTSLRLYARRVERIVVQIGRDRYCRNTARQESRSRPCAPVLRAPGLISTLIRALQIQPDFVRRNYDPDRRAGSPPVLPGSGPGLPLWRARISTAFTLFVHRTTVLRQATSAAKPLASANSRPPRSGHADAAAVASDATIPSRAAGVAGIGTCGRSS